MKLQSDAVVQRLHGLHPSLIDLSLDRISRLLGELGNPHKRLPCPIHVAGTNGKGSYLAFMQSICEAAGLKVHRYTSPHLVSFGERIVVAGKMQSDEEVIRLLEECETANNGRDITFFEITTAAAFLAFSRNNADITLIETGLGGRFDATNVLEKPALTAITPVAMDHMRFLGDDLSKIAFEKAGILKRSVPAVIGLQEPEALEVIEKRAAQLQVPLFRQKIEWDVVATEGGISVVESKIRIDLPKPSLLGCHQHSNAAQAVISARLIPELALNKEALSIGLEQATWPGRLQKIIEGKLFSTLPSGWELWIDGGHNPAAARMIADFARGWKDLPLVLIFGALNTRNPIEFLEQLLPVSDQIICVMIPGELSSLPASETSAAARKVGMSASEATSVFEALKMASSRSERGRVLICGSLYLAGAALNLNGTPPI